MRQNAASINKLRDKVRVVEAQAQASFAPPPTATYKPALTRPCSRVWDWHCACGCLVHVGRMHCPICNLHRSHGATMVGSFRGQMQASPQALQDIRRQMASLQLPSEVSVMHGRPRGASAHNQRVAPTQLSGTVVQQPLRPGPQLGAWVQPVPPPATRADVSHAPPAVADPEDDERTVPEGTSRADLQHEFIRISRV